MRQIFLMNDENELIERFGPLKCVVESEDASLTTTRDAEETDQGCCKVLAATEQKAVLPKLSLNVRRRESKSLTTVDGRGQEPHVQAV